MAVLTSLNALSRCSSSHLTHISKQAVQGQLLSGTSQSEMEPMLYLFTCPVDEVSSATVLW